MRTTLNQIRTHRPCRDGWGKLLRHLNKTAADDEPLLIETILDSNGLDDALWCLRAVDGRDRDLRLYAVWCARRVQHLMSDPRSAAVLEEAERYARGRATGEELGAAREAAETAATTTEVVVAAAARAAAALGAAADWAARAAAAAARSAAGKKEQAAQATELRRICREIEAGRDPYPEEDGR